MKLYDKELAIGTELIYNGDKIEWINPKNGKSIKTMGKGKYVVARASNGDVWIKALRKNARTEYHINKSDILDNVYQLEIADITNVVNLAFNLHKDWYVNDEALLKQAKEHNKRS